MSRNEYEIDKNKPRNQGNAGGPPHMRGPDEKPKNFKESIKKLINHMGKYRPALIGALICSAIGSATMLVGPDKLMDVTDIIIAGLATGIDLRKVGSICITLMVIFASGAILSFVQGIIMTEVTQKFSKELRTDISQKINRLPLKYFDSNTYGDILSRVTNDVDTITQMMNQGVGMLVSSITLFLGSLLLMIITNPLMAGTAVLSTVIGFFLMALLMKKAHKYFKRNQTLLGDMNGHIEEIYAGHVIVRAYNGEKAAIEGFRQINDELRESNRLSQFLSGLMMPLMHFIGNLGYVAVCVVGAVLAMNNHITFGVIVAFMMYIRNFTQPLAQIAQAMTSMQSAAAAAERVFEFLDESEMTPESEDFVTLTDVSGNVRFENVRFGYEKEKAVIKGFSADIKAGQKIAIVGPTGAGKTTIVNLLMRFYDIDSGEIYIDSAPLSKLTRENVHKLFCMVLQDTWLFEGTVKDNVVYSMGGVDEDAVIEACKAVGLHNYIMTLPKGYDTVLTDKVTLSAGQKQLITIARAMVENAPLLILDEATSSVDTRTEVLVQRAMDKLTVGRTSFVIAHRLSTIRNADVILVMGDGDIVESGNHDELIAKGGFYATLYNSQFEEAS